MLPDLTGVSMLGAIRDVFIVGACVGLLLRFFTASTREAQNFWKD